MKQGPQSKTSYTIYTVWCSSHQQGRTCSSSVPALVSVSISCFILKSALCSVSGTLTFCPGVSCPWNCLAHCLLVFTSTLVFQQSVGHWLLLCSTADTGASGEEEELSEDQHAAVNEADRVASLQPVCARVCLCVCVCLTRKEGRGQERQESWSGRCKPAGRRQTR